MSGHPAKMRVAEVKSSWLRERNLNRQQHCRAVVDGNLLQAMQSTSKSVDVSFEISRPEVLGNIINYDHPRRSAAFLTQPQ